jgi:shikimate kinase/3-dehydroquinate synthase
MAELSAEAATAVRAAVASTAAPKLVFVGFMGSGKSRASRHARRLFGIDPLDSDALLEEELGESISSFFERQGEAEFREREEALVLRLLDRPDARIISLGGGAILSATVRERLAEQLCIYMEVEAETAWDRARDSHRPLARNRSSFFALLEERAPLYESVARAIVPARDDLVEHALPEAARLVAANVPRSVRMIWAGTASGGYPVFVGEGLLDSAAALLPGDARWFVVADERVLDLHGQRLAAALGDRVPPAQMSTVPPGERHKTLAEAERVLQTLVGSGMERADTLLAFGGGVVGDLAGFCAAVYQRGVAVVQLPTTLVGQVDSAYGGKTGVDLPDAKNYVGAFHQPSAVLTDPALLATLPVEELRAGFAEVIKTGLIAGGDLWQQVSELEAVDQVVAGGPESLQPVIEQCIRTKLSVVAQDEHDKGLRASLNLGHTVAHGIEAAAAFGGYRHGEAVGLGLLVALRLSEQDAGLDPGVRDQVAELLRRHGLPTTFGGITTDQILAHAALDKKRRGGRHRLVLLQSPGRVITDYKVPEDSLREAIEEIRGVEVRS